MAKQRVAVGMSGGVDSSVAALLLQEQGYEVFGVTLRVLPPLAEASRAYDPEKDESVLKARSVADRLGIEHHMAVCDDAFTERVLKRCHNDFSRARTPNPCCYCNRYIKFGWMMDFALEHGADFLATGHYVQMKDVDGARRLFKGLDVGKDQSYFLFGVPDESRARVLTPLGGFVKSQVREIAAQHGFVNASASDSQDICFDIYGEDYTNFLTDRYGQMTRGGNFVTEEGKVLRKHDGFHRYTVGQRKGLGVALGVPAFVRNVNPETGDIVVTADKAAVSADMVQIENCVWHGGAVKPGDVFRCEGMVRYRQRPVSCEVSILEDGKAIARFMEPLFAVTPGQCAVFYDGDMVVGGGWIV
ncbi:tRNA 2-thiouridine(34) synthase MnmA [Fibrobacter sp. HC4]|uniref:tRNA 2-thiouridine(34) synthase MnmA n=1 Tax=Fibrobacter sp. HC4 TaxID=3239812 RepID=UPI002018C2C1|nr:tRNA 2-thiouridine(34) synthase MnmA [Fibrobacter succinogenes]MCL4102138.1 tRNA-specific 2-thiouridylase MnmA [Fibrobacter succinogenes]